jgi:hypothetical protein
MPFVWPSDRLIVWLPGVVWAGAGSMFCALMEVARQI